jgi:hypothetical protein
MAHPARTVEVLPGPVGKFGGSAPKPPEFIALEDPSTKARTAGLPRKTETTPCCTSCSGPLGSHSCGALSCPKRPAAYHGKPAASTAQTARGENPALNPGGYNRMKCGEEPKRPCYTKGNSVNRQQLLAGFEAPIPGRF